MEGNLNLVPNMRSSVGMHLGHQWQPRSLCIPGIYGCLKADYQIW